MIDEEVIIKQFASFCRKILKCEKIDYYRERKYRAERELHLELFEDYEVERLIIDRQIPIRQIPCFPSNKYILWIS